MTDPVPTPATHLETEPAALPLGRPSGSSWGAAGLHGGWNLDDPWGLNELPLPPVGPRATVEEVVAAQVDERWEERARRPVPAWLVASLLVHGVLLLTGFWAQQHLAPARFPESLESLEVFNVDAADLKPAERAQLVEDLAPPPPPTLSGQVVNLAPPPSPELPPDHARYLAADNHRTEQETRASQFRMNPRVVAPSYDARDQEGGGSASPGTEKPMARVSSPTPADQALSRPASDPSREVWAEGEAAAQPSRPLRLFPPVSQVASLLRAAQGARGAGLEGPEGERLGAPDNDVIDAPVGDRVRVNARQYAFEKYFRTLKSRYNFFYQQGVDNLSSRGPGGMLRQKVYATRFIFSILEDGRLGEVHMLEGSSVVAVDQVALDALRQAAPFPPPPRELLGADHRLNVPAEIRLGVGLAGSAF